MIPIRIGIIFKKPRKVTQLIIVMSNVNKATVADFLSIVQLSPASSGAIQPAISAATGTNSNPLTATMDPIAAAGKTTSIHDVPATRMMTATKVKTIPTTRKPGKTQPYPSTPPYLVKTIVTREINAKLDPK